MPAFLVDYWQFPAIAIAILLSAFFSSSETAVISCNKIRLQHRAEKGNRAARHLQHMLINQNLLLILILIGNNLANVSGSAIANSLFRQSHGSYAPLITTLVMTPLYLVFGEIIPKSLAVNLADKLVIWFIYPLRVFRILFLPVSLLLNKLVESIPRFTPTARGTGALPTKDELPVLLEISGSRDKVLDEEREIVSRTLELSEKLVREAMRPLIDVVAIPLDASVQQLASIFERTGLSKLPVFRDRIDNPIGIVAARDLLLTTGNAISIRSLIRKIGYVPETGRLHDLLSRFQAQGQDMAFVVNEYGATIGLITREDIIEEFLGEIQDEYDIAEQTPIRRIEEDQYEVDPRIEIEEFNVFFPYPLPRGEYETLSGYLLTTLHLIPLPGERIRIGKYIFTIIEADEQRIRNLHVRVEPDSDHT